MRIRCVRLTMVHCVPCPDLGGTIHKVTNISPVSRCGAMHLFVKVRVPSKCVSARSLRKKNTYRCQGGQNCHGPIASGSHPCPAVFPERKGNYPEIKNHLP